MSLTDGSACLLRIAVDPGAEGLEREHAAYRRLVGGDLPVVDVYERLPDVLFDRPASLSSWIEGSPGSGVLDVYPKLLGDLCYTTGQLARALEDGTRGTFGTAVVDGAFVAQRTRWSLEYYAMIADAYAHAHARSADLGPVLAYLLQRLEKLLPCLDAVSRFSLVHGDLRPANLVLEVTAPEEKDGLPSYDIAGVIDWELAAMGDPLLAWGMLLELPPAALAHVIDGYGREIVEDWLEQPDVLQRLEVYAIGRVVQFLALVVAAAPGEPQGARGLAHATRLGLERVAPTFVRDRLQAALAVDLEAELVIEHPPLEVDALLFRATTRVARRPMLAIREVGPWMGALAAGLRDAEHEAEGWVRDGERFLDTDVRPVSGLRGYEPLGERDRWLALQDARVRDLNSRTVGVLWLVCASLERLASNPRPGSWPVSNHVLRGVESVIEIVGSAPDASDPRERIFESVVALAGETFLARLRGRDVRRERQVERLRLLREAWEDLTVFGGDEVQAPDPQDWKVPVLLLALDGLPATPMPKEEIIRAVCGDEAT